MSASIHNKGNGRFNRPATILFKCMQEHKVATVNRVSYEQGDLQQWIRNYDDVSKDCFLGLFNIVFECDMEFLTDGSGEAIPDEFQVTRDDLERVADAVATWHLEDGDDIDSICTNFGISQDELVSLLREALDKCDKESGWVRFCWA